MVRLEIDEVLVKEKEPTADLFGWLFLSDYFNFRQHERIDFDFIPAGFRLSPVNAWLSVYRIHSTVSFDIEIGQYR